LAEAWQSGEKIAGLGNLRPNCRREAYVVQEAMAAEIGLDIAGWKVGAATPAILAERGLDAPIPGPIYDSRVHPSPAEIPASEFPDANLEAEFAFLALEAPPPRAEPYGLAELAGAVVAHAAFDLTQSRFSRAPDELLEIADSGNSGGAVIGPEVPDWRGRNLVLAAVDLRVDGGELVETYSGRRRRDPLDVLGWLVNSLCQRGICLEAGSYVLTGSVTEPQPLAPGESAVARFEGTGTVRVTVGGAEWQT
jgi:2-keto-4-pentenoate hydratase